MHHGAVGKYSSEHQFCKYAKLPLLCEITGALAKMEPGLTAGC